MLDHSHVMKKAKSVMRVAWPQMLGQGAPPDGVVKEGLMEKVITGQRVPDGCPRHGYALESSQRDLLVDGMWAVGKGSLVLCYYTWDTRLWGVAALPSERRWMPLLLGPWAGHHDLILTLDSLPPPLSPGWWAGVGRTSSTGPVLCGASVSPSERCQRVPTIPSVAVILRAFLLVLLWGSVSKCVPHLLPVFLPSFPGKCNFLVSPFHDTFFFFLMI